MALGLLFQGTRSNLNLGQSMLAGTQSGVALGQAFRAQDATMLAAQEAHRAERMAAFEMSVKAARAVSEAQDREFQRSQMELNNTVARSQIQFNQDQLALRREEFEAEIPLAERRVAASEGQLGVLEEQFELERSQTQRKQRMQDDFLRREGLLSGDPNAPFADGSGVSPRSPSRSRTSLTSPQGEGGMDSTLFGGGDGGEGPTISTIVKGDFSNVAAEDIASQLSPQLAKYAQDFVEAGKKYGIDPRFLAAVSRLESNNGLSAAFRNKNNAMGIMESDGGSMKLVEFGSVADSIDAQARKIADENGPYAGRDTIGDIGAVYAPPGNNDRRDLNSGWPSNVAKFYGQMAGDNPPPPPLERPAPTPPETNQILPSGAAPQTADQLDPRSTIEARSVIANRGAVIVDIDQMIESKHRALQMVAEKKQTAERRADRTAQFLDLPFVSSVDIENLSDTEAFILEEINVFEKQRVKANQEALMAQAIIDQQTALQGTKMSTGDVKDLSVKMGQYETADAMIEKLDQLKPEEFLAITEGVKGFLRKFEDLPGGEFFLGSGRLNVSPIKSEFLALRASLLNIVLKERSGAAVTDNELERFLMEVGDPANMSRESFDAATRRWAGDIKRGYEREVQAYLHQNIFVSPNLNPFNPSPRMEVDPSNVRTPAASATDPNAILDGAIREVDGPNGKVTIVYDASKKKWVRQR